MVTILAVIAENQNGENGEISRLSRSGDESSRLCTRADDESSSNLRALKGKHHCFSISL